MTANINGYLYVENIKLNKQFITDNPVPQTEQKNLCCNQEKFALNRCKSRAAPMKKNYYNSTREYLRARCNLYEQKVFNFKTNGIDEQTNLQIYKANCVPSSNNDQSGLTFNLLQILVQLNISPSIPPNVYTFEQALNYINSLPAPNNQYGNNIYFWYMNDPYMGVPAAGPIFHTCPQVMYKPNNIPFAVQGAVSGQSYTQYKNYQTIAYDTNPSNYSKKKFGPLLKQCNGLCLDPHIRGGI
jgi:hypothetical protein